MSWIRAYGCVTAAGDTVGELWHALRSGRVRFSDIEGSHALLFDGPLPETVMDLLVSRSLSAFQAVAPTFNRGVRSGVILASTKGVSNDFIWRPAPEDLARDPLTPLLSAIMRRAEIRAERSVCVSNACSSTLAALHLAQLWLEQGLEQVVVFAADAVTPFVARGFQSLNLISPGLPRPFSQDRAGFWLGEAAACLLISREPGGYYLHPVRLDSEGSLVTRPAESSASHARAMASLPAPDVIVAHGTGTPINDQTEDLAFQLRFGDSCPPITGTKWCVGHTLGASAAIDIIAACEILRTGDVFPLATTEEVDPALKGTYLHGTSRPTRGKERTNRILVSSLGFGGLQAAAVVEAGSSTTRSLGDLNTPTIPSRTETREHSLAFPFTEPPEWADQVERWYQLDAPAAALADVYWRNRDLPRPALILLASPAASNHTDAQFAAAPPSPAKFVHTLPNVRLAPMLRLMEWSGPTLCLQNDPETLATALREAAKLAGDAPVWVVGAEIAGERWIGYIHALCKGRME